MPSGRSGPYDSSWTTPRGERILSTMWLRIVLVGSLVVGFMTPGEVRCQVSPRDVTVLVSGDLVPISWLTVSPKGVLAVWQDQDGVIRRFDTTGNELASVGASGEGPGEFRMMSVGGFVGESLWVSDPMLR